MARNRTSASGGQDRIPAPASGNTVQGRGRRRAQGRGRGRVAAPVDVQVPVATQGRDRTIPPDAEVIHGDVQDRVEGDGPAQALPSSIVPRNASRYLVSYVRNPKGDGPGRGFACHF